MSNSSERTAVASIEINESARQVLAEYLTRSAPGYALLLDAPWGAGKTHFIKRETGCDRDKQRLYVSLYGVATTADFDWALVRALKPFTDSYWAKWGKQFSNLVSAVKVPGLPSFDLNKFTLTEIVLSSLPDTIIFDDLERCLIKPDELFGLLNRFVEHQGKRLILVANAAKHKQTEAFQARRDKLIGRTVKIDADVDAAIETFWNDIQNGVGKTFMQSRKQLLVGVFRDARHNNLRLFRQSLVDAAHLLDAVDAHLMEKHDAVERLICTYIVLSMAFAGNEIHIDELEKRASYKSFESQAGDQPIHALKIIQDRHPYADIQGYQNSILPVDLAVELIGHGYASGPRINGCLRATFHFATKAETPNWMRLWNWYEESESELAKLVETVDRDLQSNAITVPGEIVQIFGAKVFIQKFGGLTGSSADLADEFIEIINRLAQNKLLPAFRPEASNRGGYGYSKDGHFSYGGYAMELDEQTLRVVNAMSSAQDARYKEEMPKIASDLLHLLADDPIRFIDRFDYQPTGLSFSRTPILHSLDTDAFATILLGLIENNLSVAAEICDKLIQRREIYRTELQLEHTWFDRLRTVLMERVAESSALKRAKILLFIRRHLTSRSN